MEINLRTNRFAALAFLLFMLTSTLIYSQTKRVQRKEGKVIFITPQNVYVSFNSTDGITPGDTLFLLRSQKLIPAVLVHYRSEQSCAGPKIRDIDLSNGDIIVAFAKIGSQKSQSVTKLVQVTQDTAFTHSVVSAQPIELSGAPIVTPSQNVYGGLSANSYSNFSNYSNSTNFQRWFYSLNLNADHISGSNFYFTNFMNFTYLANQWNGISSSFFNNLMIYNLAFGYKTNCFQAWLGRRINNNVPDLGSIDGAQAEARLGNLLSVGATIGTRPDFYNMNYDPKLLEFGGYLTRGDTLSSGFMSNTIGVFQQDNAMRTDRRFLYFQHRSYFFNSLSFYLSVDADLFKLQNGLPTSTFSLTNLFFSSSYTPISLVSFNLSFSALRNIIYYQTFTSTIDSLLLSQNQLRQNVTGSVSLRPALYTYVNLRASYSFQTGDILPTRDAGITVTQSQIPLLLISATATYDRLMSSYVSGGDYGLMLSKYIPFNFSSISIGYSRIKYTYGNGAGVQIQNTATAQGTTRILGNLYFNIFYQGTFTNSTSYSSIMGGLNLRF